MEKYGWTWPELQATPLYVRRVAVHLMNAQAEASKTKG